MKVIFIKFYHPHLNFERDIDRLILGIITVSEFPEIALKALEEGFDTESLTILAGLTPDEEYSRINYYFNQTVRELSLSIPDKRQAAINYARTLIEEMNQGKRNVFKGTEEFINICLDGPLYEKDLKYAYDSRRFSKGYGLFDSLRDLDPAGTTRWSDEKTNSEIEEELKALLLEELNIWSKNFNP
jgi:hypothetical protein